MHAGAIAPGTRSRQTRTPSTFFFLVREKGGFVRTLRTPLGYVPVMTEQLVEFGEEWLCCHHFDGKPCAEMTVPLPGSRVNLVHPFYSSGIF